MIAQGLARAGEIDLETLAHRIDEERRAADGTIVWDVAFLVAGRFGHAG